MDTPAGQEQTINSGNIWALDKHQSIKHVLLLLVEQLGRDAFVVESRINTDQQAIYICQPDEPDVRAYLYTTGQAEEHYGVHLEYPLLSEANPIYDAFENVSLASLAEILAVHFGVAEIHPLPVLH
ncbi:MAG: hypothetical protein CMI03_19165 [Oceanospirillaceae bacterium]|uniref:hypothetical protein n=1 Tax=unclassified Thalassolituus TaxID=2624967 RepID=UPI000C08DD5A|nr:MULTISPECIES: hypothetical protein [unclassified Thalassolituus]MAK91036.1 hypothetical protein [Thalassolituus sp.]MAS24417.1 hypothetical protein [Oceanospirillaceae bacterium]MBL35373.1 hypothetical protein [Oceanospirillaceae bacterium]MBS54864.1 hypothetical protein [Oceanospirillaceae bacterium]|tara:strand:+ start:28 stop:405 length:378 start_codon:yes stop_codon:yes gene_type:complete